MVISRDEKLGLAGHTKPCWIGVNTNSIVIKQCIEWTLHYMYVHNMYVHYVLQYVIHKGSCVQQWDLHFFFDWPQHFQVLGRRIDFLTFTRLLGLHKALVTMADPATWIDDNLLASSKTLIVLLHQSIGEGPLVLIQSSRGRCYAGVTIRRERLAR